MMKVCKLKLGGLAIGLQIARYKAKHNTSLVESDSAVLVSLIHNLIWSFTLWEPSC